MIFWKNLLNNPFYSYIIEEIMLYPRPDSETKVRSIACLFSNYRKSKLKAETSAENKNSVFLLKEYRKYNYRYHFYWEKWTGNEFYACILMNGDQSLMIRLKKSVCKKSPLFASNSISKVNAYSKSTLFWMFLLLYLLKCSPIQS